MKLEFKVYKLKETSFMYKEVMKNNSNNEFIIVGEEQLSDDYDCFKVHQLNEKGIKIIKRTKS